MREVTGFSAGEVLGEGFAIYFKNLVSFIPLSLVAFIPVWVGLVVFGEIDPDAVPLDWGSLGPSWLLGMVGGYWLQAAMIYGAISTLRDGNPGIVEIFSKSLQALFPVLLLAIVLTVLIGVGLVLLIVPGVILAIMFWVAVPAAVVERQGVGAAITRSMELTKGHRWSIFGLMALGAVLYLVVLVVLGMVGEALGDFSVWVVNLGSMVVAGIWSVVIAVCYHDLRILKEGGGTEQIAKVFD